MLAGGGPAEEEPSSVRNVVGGGRYAGDIHIDVTWSCMTRLPPGDVRHATGTAPMPSGLASLVVASVVYAVILAGAIAAHPPAASAPAGASACRMTCTSYRPAVLVGRRSGTSPTDANSTGPDAWPSGAFRVATASTPTRATSQRPSSATKPSKTKRTHRLIAGVATWHATGRDGAFAAAGPLLREALGRGWRGTRVQVCSGGHCIRVTLNDVCWCPKGRRLVDLSDEAFARLASLSRGVIAIEIRR